VQVLKNEKLLHVSGIVCSHL